MCEGGGQQTRTHPHTCTHFGAPWAHGTVPIFLWTVRCVRVCVRVCELTRPDVSPVGACMQFRVDRTTLATKSSTRVTGIGGSTMDGRSVRSAFSFPGESVNAERFVDVDHTGKVVHDHRPEIALLTDPATKQPCRSAVASDHAL